MTRLQLGASWIAAARSAYDAPAGADIDVAVMASGRPGQRAAVVVGEKGVDAICWSLWNDLEVKRDALVGEASCLVSVNNGTIRWTSGQAAIHWHLDRAEPRTLAGGGSLDVQAGGWLVILASAGGTCPPADRLLHQHLQRRGSVRGAVRGMVDEVRSRSGRVVMVLARVEPGDRCLAESELRFREMRDGFPVSQVGMAGGWYAPGIERPGALQADALTPGAAETAKGLGTRKDLRRRAVALLQRSTKGMAKQEPDPTEPDEGSGATRRRPSSCVTWVLQAFRGRRTSATP